MEIGKESPQFAPPVTNEPDASGRAPGTNGFFRGAPVPRHRPTNHRMSRTTRKPMPLSRRSSWRLKRDAERSDSTG